MDIAITGRGLELDDTVKSYVQKRLNSLGHLYRRIYRCEVVLAEEKTRKNVEVILHLKRNRMVAKESSPDIYTSIDNAAGSIKKQLRRLNERVSSKRRRSVINKIIGPMARLGRRREVFVEERGRIVKADFFADKPMLPEEAKLELELAGRAFLMFKNADTGQANVIYKKDNGDYGLIEPSF